MPHTAPLPLGALQHQQGLGHHAGLLSTGCDLVNHHGITCSWASRHSAIMLARLEPSVTCLVFELAGLYFEHTLSLLWLSRHHCSCAFVISAALPAAGPAGI